MLVLEVFRIKKILIFCLLLLFVPLVTALTPPSGGILYYNFSSVTDLWGSNNAVNTGASSNGGYPSFNINGDSSPSSYSYDGSNDYQSYTSSGITNTYTISVWVKPDQTTGDYVFSGGTLDGILYSSSSYFNGYGGSSCNVLTSTTSINTANWYHLLLTGNATKTALFVNGVEEDSDSCSATWNTARYIGRSSSGSYWDGLIDEYKVFDRVLTDTEIENLYDYGVINPVLNFSVSAEEIISSSTILNFSVLVDGVTYNTSSGSVVTLIDDSSLYNVTIFADGFVNRTYENYNVSSDLVAELYSYNSILVYGFEQDDGSVVSDFNISVFNSNYSYSVVSSGGVAEIDSVVAGVYSVVVSAVNFTDATYSVILADGSYQQVNAYLVSTIDDFTFLVKGKDDDSVIEDVLIVMSRFVNGSIVPISSKYTDITGRVEFDYEVGSFYSFSASKSGYLTKTFNLPEILYNEYIILLEFVSVDNPDIYIDDVVTFPLSYSFVNGSSYFAIRFSSDLSSLTYYYVNLTLPNGSVVSDYGYSASGGVVNSSVVVPVVTFGDFASVDVCYKSVVNSGEKCVSSVYMFSKWSDVTGGLGRFKDDMGSRSDLEKVFWFCVIMISLASLFAGAGLFAGDSFLFACLGGIIGAVLGIVFALVTWEVGGIIIFILVLFALGKVVNDG